MKKTSKSQDYSDELLRDIFRHAEVGFALVDLHGSILEVNDAFCRILGCEQSSFAISNVTDLVVPEQKEETEELIARLARGEIANYKTVRRYRRRDGGEVSTKVTSSVVKDSDGEVACAVELVEDIGPRLAAEQALRESEMRYRRIVEDQGEYIVRWLPDGTRTFVNEAYARYVGRPRNELIGESFFPLIPSEEDRDAVRRKILALTPENPVAINRHQAVTSGGEEVWHEWVDRGFFDEDGNLVELQSVGRDVTAEHLARKALERSELRYRQLFEDLPVASWESDWTRVVERIREHGIRTEDELLTWASGDPGALMDVANCVRALRANSLALELFGAQSLSDLTSWMPSALMSARSLDIVRGVGRIILGGARVATEEISVLSRTGERRTVLVRWARSETDENEWTIVVTAIDLTELHATKQELERQKTIFEHAERIARIGSFETSAEAGTMYGSGSFWSIVLGGDHQAETRPDSEFWGRVHPDDLSALEQRAEERADEGLGEPTQAPLEFRLVRPDNSVRIVSGRGFFERNAEGKVSRGFGIIRDITKEKADEIARERERQQLIRADRLISLGTLVGGVAHEINNPNQFIMLNTPLLKHAWDDVLPIVDTAAVSDPALMVGGLPWREMRSEVGEIVNDILEGADRINGIVSELRDFTRDGDSAEESEVDVNDVVRGAQRLVASQIRKATDTFTMELASDLPHVVGRKQRLEELMINLLLNSCEASTAGAGRIVVRTRLDERAGHIVIEVHDEGSGIAEANLERVFDPFFTTKRAAGGTGLGLAIAGRIISDHGGQISFESAPESGTTAFVRIPVPAAAEP